MLRQMESSSSQALGEFRRVKYSIQNEMQPQERLRSIQALHDTAHLDPILPAL
jgi:hypothetical protein